MNSNNFINKLNELHLGVFTDTDAKKIINKNKNYCNLYLYRLAKKNYIIRIRKGLYALKESSKFEIAGSIIANSYITSLAALFYHELINQDPNFIEVANTKYSKTLHIKKDFGAINIELKKLPKTAFFGYYKTMGNIGMFFIAEPEKAIIDILLLHNGDLLSYVEDVMKEHKININKVLKYAKITGKKSIHASIIKIIEKYEINII